MKDQAIMKTMYLDCFSGASGDMVLGALVDAGLPLETLREALKLLPLSGYDLKAERVQRAGVGAMKICVVETNKKTSTHEHRHHEHRSMSDIEKIIKKSTLPERVKIRSIELFTRLAKAEAKIHGLSVEKVHFHEVGALDSIVDIVGAVYAFDWFGVDQIMASPLNMGHGTVKCQHGEFPVPAPATADLIQGVPVYSEGARAELLTPTGALLVTGHAKCYGEVPRMVIEQIGYGAGDRDFQGRPNVLRILIGDAGNKPVEPNTERIVVIQTEIDDMNPQIFGLLMEKLYIEGALEVYFTSVQMKKNRPGTLVTVIARPEQRKTMHQILFRETTTLGVRYLEMTREALVRFQVRLETPLGVVSFKVAKLGDEEINVAPEFSDCARVASEQGLAVKDVQAIVMKAYLERTK